MQRGRDPQTGLNTLDMHTTSIKPKLVTEIPFLERFCANNSNWCKSKQDLVIYYNHACFFSTKSTWIKYIKNNFFTTWPGLTVELLTEYLPNSILTAKGNLCQSYKLTRSTKQYVVMTKPFPEVTGKPPYSTDNGKTYEFPHDHGSKTNNIFFKYTTQVRKNPQIKRDVFQPHLSKKLNMSWLYI